MQTAAPAPEATQAGRPFYKRRAALLGIVLLIVIVASGAYYLTRRPSSPVGSAPASPYSLQITRVAQYGNATVNEYYLSVNATYSGSATWEFNPIHFKLVSSASSSYSAILGLDQSLLFYYFCRCLPPGIQIIRAVDLLKGQHATGQIIFKLPPGQIPARLDYYEPLAGISIQVMVPQVSTWISGPWLTCCFPPPAIQGAGTLTVQVSCRAHTYSGYCETGPIIYYTGDTMPLMLGVIYFNGTNDPSSITVSQITDSDPGLRISSIQPAPPLTVLGAGPCCSISPSNQNRMVDVSVSIEAPAYSLTEGPHFTITVIP